MIGRSRDRFAAIPEWVLLHPSMRSKAGNLLTYTGICMLANYKDRTGDPDWQEIARLTGQSRSAIYRALGDLRDSGIITLRDDGMYDLPLDNPVDKSPANGIRPPKESQQRDAESQQRDATVPFAGFAPLSTEGSEVSQRGHANDASVEIANAASLLYGIAHQQRIKPPSGNRRQVLALLADALRRGWTYDEIEQCIRDGVGVWTLAGLDVALAKSNPRDRRSASDGDGRSILELAMDVAQAEGES